MRLTARCTVVSTKASYRRKAARVAVAVELKYSGGSMKPQWSSGRPLTLGRGPRLAGLAWLMWGTGQACASEAVARHTARGASAQ